jgi:hypothetical protein
MVGTCELLAATHETYRGNMDVKLPPGRKIPESLLSITMDELNACPESERLSFLLGLPRGVAALEASAAAAIVDSVDRRSAERSSGAGNSLGLGFLSRPEEVRMGIEDELVASESGALVGLRLPDDERISSRLRASSAFSRSSLSSLLS